MIGELGEDRIVQKKLREVAARITSDVELQKDLVQEMSLHLLQVQRDTPDKAFSWYMKGCEFHARNYLRLGRSVDSYKRAKGAVRFIPIEDGGGDEFFLEQFFYGVGTMETSSSQQEAGRDDLLELITPRLSGTQRTILTLLMQDYGIREIAAKIGISHPAVIKHRKKIAKTARQLIEVGEFEGNDQFAPASPHLCRSTTT